MSSKEIQYITSDKDTHFTTAIAQHAIDVETLNLPADWVTLGINNIIVEGISIQSDQNLEWDVMLFTDSNANNVDLDIASFSDFFNFATTSGKQIGATAQFYYSSPSNFMAIPYQNTDNEAKIYIGLVNRSGTSKNAGATGEFTIKLALRPVWGV